MNKAYSIGKRMFMTVAGFITNMNVQVTMLMSFMRMRVSMNNYFFIPEIFYQPINSQCNEHYSDSGFKIMKILVRNSCFKNDHQHANRSEERRVGKECS